MSIWYFFEFEQKFYFIIIKYVQLISCSFFQKIDSSKNSLEDKRKFCKPNVVHWSLVPMIVFEER